MSKKLIAASDHLWYEIWMFCNLVRHLEADREIDQVSNNALVESFAIHTRILIDFFGSSHKCMHDSGMISPMHASA